MYVDFAKLKASITIEQVIEMLNVPLTKKGEQLRGPCPIHDGDNPRQFVVTPSKGVWYCFGDCDGGGDIIELVARMRGCSAKDAAAEIATHFGHAGEREQRPSRDPGTPATSGKKLRPLDYLQADHEALTPLGLSTDTYEHFGAGYAGKGIMRGRLAVPIYSNDGELLAYVGRAVKEDQSPTFLFPKDFDPQRVIFNMHNAAPDTLYVCHDPLQVLKAYEHGIENCVALLCELSPQLLRLLAEMMDEHGVETCELT